MTDVKRVTFLVLPRFQMLGYVLATESLRIANRVCGRPAFAWRTVGPGGVPVPASNGESVRVDGDPAAAGPSDLAVVCAGFAPLDGLDVVCRAWLRRRARHGVALAGIGAGGTVLAELGLLNGYRASVHPQAVAGFRERYPGVTLEDAAYVFDRERLTAAGGTASGDAILAWMAVVGGPDLAARTASAMVRGEMRATGAEPVPALSQPRDALVRAAVAVMTNALDDPPPIAEVARRVGTDGRTLTRRFRAVMGRPPAAVLMGLRLERARDLLAETDMTAADVATACGFASPIWFSQAYTKRFGLPPGRHRRVLRAPIAAGAGSRPAQPLFTGHEKAL